MSHHYKKALTFRAKYHRNQRSRFKPRHRPARRRINGRLVPMKVRP